MPDCLCGTQQQRTMSVTNPKHDTPPQCRDKASRENAHAVHECGVRGLPPISANRRTVALGIGGLIASAGFAGALMLGSDGAPSQAEAQRLADAAKFPLDELLVTGDLDDMALGEPDAPVTIIEYASMTCGHCGRFHRDVYGALKEKYIETGKVRFIYREFPLDNYAMGAAMLARCMPKDKFFPFVGLMFDKQSDWAYVRGNRRLDTLFEYAKQAGFTREKFEACLGSQELLEDVQWIQNRGRDEFAVTSTPTFFINGEKLRGRHTIETFEEMIDPHLQS